MWLTYLHIMELERTMGQGTRKQLAKINTVSSITVGEYDIDPGLCAINLGVWFDCQLNLSTHVTKFCNAAFYHLNNIRCIKKYLSRNSLLTLMHAFITSRLDYCNSVLFGLPKSQNAKLQRIRKIFSRYTSTL